MLDGLRRSSMGGLRCTLPISSGLVLRCKLAAEPKVERSSSTLLSLLIVFI